MPVVQWYYYYKLYYYYSNLFVNPKLMLEKPLKLK